MSAVTTMTIGTTKVDQNKESRKCQHKAGQNALLNREIEVGL